MVVVVVLVWPNFRATGRTGAALLVLRISACSAFIRLVLAMAITVGAIKKVWVRDGRMQMVSKWKKGSQGD